MAKKVQPATANIFSMVARPVSTIKDSEIVEALRECKGLIYLAAAKLGCTHSDLDFRVKTNEDLKKAAQHISMLTKLLEESDHGGNNDGSSERTNGRNDQDNER